ncbi:MAG: hypothetical protein KAS32_24325 [Candidatus Peribacteraceae bacterium]|nr:hypothetical protein [Candidatus Peribacteraceae bacterium]
MNKIIIVASSLSECNVWCHVMGLSSKDIVYVGNYDTERFPSYHGAKWVRICPMHELRSQDKYKQFALWANIKGFQYIHKTDWPTLMPDYQQLQELQAQLAQARSSYFERVAALEAW